MMTEVVTTKHSKTLGDILVERRLLTPEQVTDVLAEQQSSTTRRLFGEIIVDFGFCTTAQVTEALADSYGVPFAHIHSGLVDSNVSSVLQYEFMQSHSVLPMYKVDGILTIAVTEPANVFLFEEIVQLVECPVQIVAALKLDIDSTLELLQPESNSINIEAMLEQHDINQSYSAASSGLLDMDVPSDKAPVVQLVNHLILSAVQAGASDIHIEPDDGALRVRFRIDGTLSEILRPPYRMHAEIVSRVKIMANLDIAERRLPQDGAISVTIKDNRVDLRVSTLPNKFGEKVVIRVIDTRNTLVNLEQLGMASDVYESFAAEVKKPHGLILVTGPTGSGKSTTLYAVLNEINDASINICTVEDPVEFQIPDINQFQVHEKIGLGFASVLRSLLRQDPDVIMLGEIRDPETARIAVQAALTGHLVLSTLHTNDSASAVTRLHNLQVESYLISASLVSIVAQRLVRSLCPKCKTKVEPSAATMRVLDHMNLTVENHYGGTGCTHCNQTGLKGRIGIYELLVPDDELRDAIASDIPLGAIRARAKELGMKTLLLAGLEAANEGLTTVEEVLRVTSS